MIIASDVTYVSHLHEHLADVIAKLLTKPNSKCWIAHQQRVLNLSGADYQLESFVKAAETSGLNLRVLDDVNESGEVKMLEMHKTQNDRMNDDAGDL